MRPVFSDPAVARMLTWQSVIDGTRDLAECALPPLRRLRRWLGLPPDPRLRRPEVARLRPIRRGWAPAALEARAAVAAGVPLVDYLRARLARYETALAIPRARLPMHVELAGGEIRSTLLPGPPAGAETAAGAVALEELDGPSAVREWAQVHARIAGLEEEAAAARRRTEELADRLSADVARGEIVTAPDEEIAAEALGRPAVRSSDAVYAFTAITVAMVAAEAWGIAVPVLFLAGAYPPALSGPQALQSAFLLAFSLGAAVGLFALAFATLEVVERLARGATHLDRRRLLGFAAVLGLAAAMAAARAATLSAPRSGIPPASHAILLLAIPVGAAFTLRRAQRAHAARAAERAAALAWDRERALVLGDRARRLEELAWAESALDAARRRLARARLRSRELARRADTAARLLAGAALRHHREGLRLAQSLLAALERDRYEYLRSAAAHRAEEPARTTPAAPAQPSAPAVSTDETRAEGGNRATRRLAV